MVLTTSVASSLRRHGMTLARGRSSAGHASRSTSSNVRPASSVAVFNPKGTVERGGERSRSSAGVRDGGSTTER
jgi:hypothetical protein